MENLKNLGHVQIEVLLYILLTAYLCELGTGGWYRD
jgi:hypothetical protein